MGDIWYRVIGYRLFTQYEHDAYGTGTLTDNNKRRSYLGQNITNITNDNTVLNGVNQAKNDCKTIKTL